MEIKKIKKLSGSGVFARPSRLRCRAFRGFDPGPQKKESFFKKIFNKLVRVAVPLGFLVASFSAFGLAGPKIPSVGNSVPIYTTSTTLEPRSKSVASESFTKLKSSAGVLGVGSAGLLEAAGVNPCPTHLLRHEIPHPVKYGTTAQQKFSSHCMNPFSLIYNVTNYYQSFERGPIVDFQAKLIHKFEIVKEHLNITGCLCFNNTVTKNFKIVSPQWHQLSIRAASLNQELKKPQTELLPTIDKLNKECDQLFREILILRFELAVIRHKGISTPQNRVVRVESNQDKFANLEKPGRFLNRDEAQAYLLLYEDIVKAACSHYYLQEIVDGSFYKINPFYHHVDFQKGVEKGISRQDLIANDFLGLIPENWVTLLEEARPIGVMPIEKIFLPPSPSIPPARRVADQIRNNDVPGPLPIEGTKSTSDGAPISEPGGSVDDSGVQGMGELGQKVAAIALARYSSLSKAHSGRAKVPSSPGVVSSKSPQPVTKKQKRQAPANRQAPRPLALPAPTEGRQS